MRVATAFLAGLVFGLGLLLSGMADPAKVLGFLDLAGAWDPSLMFVMGGAVGVGAVAFGWARRRRQSLLGEPLRLPTTTAIDRRLLLGALLFGAGWGVAGFCPGPALVALGVGETKAVVFAIAMLAGMGLFELIERATAKR
jgi:uncharacterized membrane protein YedE/YeeE